MIGQRRRTRVTTIFQEDLPRLRMIKQVKDNGKIETDAEVLNRVLGKLDLKEPNQNEFDIKLRFDRKKMYD